MPSSDKKIQANRENAKLSTGPVTPEGKSICSHNAVKTGLTGQTVVLKTDKIEIYNAHVQRFIDKYKPANQDEKDLVQDIADTEWRLLRITPLENSILALGRRELASLFDDESDLAVREELLEAKVQIEYRRDLTNLYIQQGRLRRHRKSVIEELETIQKERERITRIQSGAAADYYLDALKKGWTSMDLKPFGSEFTLEDMLNTLAIRKARTGLDSHPDITRPQYLEAYRQEFNQHFGEQ